MWIKSETVTENTYVPLSRVGLIKSSTGGSFVEVDGFLESRQNISTVSNLIPEIGGEWLRFAFNAGGVEIIFPMQAVVELKTLKSDDSIASVVTASGVFDPADGVWDTLSNGQLNSWLNSNT